MIISIEVTELHNGGRYFDVSRGDESSGQVTFEEMLGLVAALTIPNERRCLQWMQTQDYRKRMEERLQALRCEGNE